MSTIEDFKNAPPSATATCPDGTRAMKMDDDKQRWVTPSEVYLNNEGMVYRNYTLDAPVSTTVREALDLAWELAHEVKEGQVIPKGARCLTVSNSEVKEYTTKHDVRIMSAHATVIRTLEPLPDPEPDWIDASAVTATCERCKVKTLHSPLEYGGKWECTRCQTTSTSHALTGVTPLYPKGQEA